MDTCEAMEEDHLGLAAGAAGTAEPRKAYKLAKKKIKIFFQVHSLRNLNRPRVQICLTRAEAHDSDFPFFFVKETIIRIVLIQFGGF